MIKSIGVKKIFFLACFLLLAFFSYQFGLDFLANFAKAEELEFSDSPKKITLIDNDASHIILTKAATFENLLQEQNIPIGNHDVLIPTKETVLFPNMTFLIQRAVKTTIQVDNKNIENFSIQKTIGGVLSENNISLSQLDKVSPEILSRPYANSEIIVTRINIEEKIIPEDIAFKTISKEDAKLGWREEKIEQKGEKGIREVKYKITYKNGKEISRVALEKNITQEPVPQIITKGTYMKLAKAEKGHASFYARSWGELNASRSIPRGGYAKVTNLDNGKSTIIKINDYGPQAPERIIDLSYASFAKIGNLGQGILPNVKVEQVLN